MLEHVRGDLFASGAEGLVNPVNCVGVMGRGLALQFRRRFPGNYSLYRRACARGLVLPGRIRMEPELAGNLPRIFNLPTKRHWRDRSRLEDVEAGLKRLRELLETDPLRSVAVPPLGCGLGGLRWSAVRPLVERELGRLPMRVLVYGPEGGNGRTGR